MLFMDIVTWEPEKQKEVQKRASEWKIPEEMKINGYWIDITGHRAFVLSEVDDPKVILATSDYWTDIVKVVSVPVMEMEEVMKLMSEA
jgi:hypothetical protein